MGIRFYCPNGHRLNVKDFLAGKRGICPHCEVRFRIPPKSEIPKGSPKVKPGSAAEMAFPVSPRRRGGVTILQAATIDKPAVSVRMKSDNTVDKTEQDPIEESPESVWYIRPPAGGQYGPAKGEVVRRWIAEGRVSADSLVWREGWTDWRLAGPIFPSLAGLNAIATRLDMKSESSAASPAVDAAPLPALPTPRKEPKQKKSAAMVIGLVLLIVTLAAGLVTVLVLKS